MDESLIRSRTFLRLLASRALRMAILRTQEAGLPLASGSKFPFWSARKIFTKVSCVTSSASGPEPRIRRICCWMWPTSTMHESFSSLLTASKSVAVIWQSTSLMQSFFSFPLRPAQTTHQTAKKFHYFTLKLVPTRKDSWGLCSREAVGRNCLIPQGSPPSPARSAELPNPTGARRVGRNRLIPHGAPLPRARSVEPPGPRWWILPQGGEVTARPFTEGLPHAHCRSRPPLDGNGPPTLAMSRASGRSPCRGGARHPPGAPGAHAPA